MMMLSSGSDGGRILTVLGNLKATKLQCLYVSILTTAFFKGITIEVHAYLGIDCHDIELLCIILDCRYPHVVMIKCCKSRFILPPFSYILIHAICTKSSYDLERKNLLIALLNKKTISSNFQE